MGLKRSRVEPAAALAFWLGNPVLNPAVLVFIGFVLGWGWAVLRLLLGVVLVVAVARFAGRLADPPGADARQGAEAAIAAAQAADAAAATRPWIWRWLRACGDLAIGLVPEYLILVLALGAARAFLFPTITPVIGGSLWLLLAMAVAGTLFVIPTGGEVPILQTLGGFGLGAGPAGALLMVLPATSLPSLAMLARTFRAKALVAVAGGVAVFGLIGGLLAMGLRL